jgi:N-acetylmuramoyl-L-alanine amidase
MATATIIETILRNETGNMESSEEEAEEGTVSDTPVTDETETEPEMDLYDPDLPVTQEILARRMEASMDKQVRGGSRIYYPWPSGAMAVDLYKDGRQILKGQVADIGGTVYVPVQRFADLFGSFKTVYTEATEQVVITGTNLSIAVKVGDPYITVNERIFYTGKRVISLGGWIFVPLTSMCKALNATVNIRSGYYDAFITSGDVTGVKWASEYYDSTDLYWLSRIISAEAKGEPFAGQIAVGNVVLNRVRSSQFPSTVKGVIFDTKYGTQFSPVSSGTIYQTPTSSAIMAAKICLEGYSLSTQMIYFYNPKIATSSWIGRTRPYIMTVGNHKFYG